MRTLMILTAAATAMLLLAAPTGAMEKKTKKIAQELVEKHKDAIVLVEVVMKITATYNGRQYPDQERKLEINGTVISADGLTVVSSAQADPPVRKRPGLRVDISTTSVKIILADGTEHDAKIVQTDKDLDMAFVRPKKKITLPFVQLKKAGEPKLLDDLISITRLGRKARRTPGVVASRVLSVIKKPRLRYVASGAIFQGCPVFNSAGEVLGLSLRRTSGGAALAVLTSEDILEIAKDVPAVKAKEKTEAKQPDEEKTEDKKPAGSATKTEEKTPKKGEVVEEQLPPVMKGGK
jgi:S1-C subfamily serine protease